VITLTYTQHSVAFPTVKVGDDSETDSVSVSLDDSGGGTHGEFVFRFVHFRNLDTLAVQMTCFGDGLVCLYDPRVQQVVQQWREMPDPDAMSPGYLCELLGAAGAVPSRYMKP
jgi:hypothetical protein